MANNYLFLDANSSILTASSSVVGGAHQPLIQIASVLSALPITITSVVGSVSVSQAGVWTTSVVGTVSLSSIAGAVTLYAQPDSFVWGTSSIITGTTAASVLAAPGSSLRNYITAIKVTNAAATGVIVDIKDSGGDVLDTGYAAASGGGWSTSYPTPLKQTSTNKSVDAVPRAQGSVLVAISGFKAA